MSLQVEKLEKNMAKLTVEVPAEQFDKAIKAAYDRRIKTDLISQASVKERLRRP